MNTIVSSLLRVGEKLGEELHGRPPDYHWLNLGGPGILLVPCGEEAALVVRIDQGSNASPLIEAALGIAKQIPVLLKDRGET
ncbi:hypothetical protein [Candidatus Methylocalor cossyra]|uniref:Uncharacterized protein n=1 Tax=Candidatus Methylocalor cossyra TaxID=3108543 RepID=A0ABM9NEW6_9GAMM